MKHTRKTKRKTKITLSEIFMFIFAVAGVIGMIGRVLCMRPNGDYQELQPELFAPDVIDIVLADE